MNKPIKPRHICFCMTIALSMQVFANGIYFVSGADFRRPILKYVIQTTTPNEEVEVTPFALKSFSTINGVQNTQPYTQQGWSIKYDGVNHDVAKTNAVRQFAKYDGLVSWNVVQQLAPGATNMSPITHVFANPGNHMVNIYSPSWNVFSVLISNPAVTKVSIDLENLPYSAKTYTRWGVGAVNSPSITKIIYANPMRQMTTIKDIHKLSGLKEFVTKHPDMIIGFDNNAFAYCPELVMDFSTFTNATLLGSMCFRDCSKIRYVSLPKLQSVGGYAFSLGSVPTEGFGLQTLRLGDNLTSVGKDALGRQTVLNTIEFVTNDPNWLDAWNNHPILPNWFGQASSQNGNEATLTPTSNADAAAYYTGTFINTRPKPTKLAYVGGYGAN